MKTKLGIFLAGCCLLAFTACEKDLQPYNTPGAWLNFAFRESSGDLITSSEGLYDEIYDTYYSFALQSATTGTDITQDTVWIEVSTMGFLSDQDRQVELQQVVTGENDAVSGVHYVAFDDPWPNPMCRRARIWPVSPLWYCVTLRWTSTTWC